MSHVTIVLNETYSTCLLYEVKSNSHENTEWSVLSKYSSTIIQTTTSFSVNPYQSLSRKEPEGNCYNGIIRAGYREYQSSILEYLYSINRDMTFEYNEDELTIYNNLQHDSHTYVELMNLYIGILIKEMSKCTNHSITSVTLLFPDVFKETLKLTICQAISEQCAVCCNGHYYSSLLCSYYLPLNVSPRSYTLCCVCSEQDIVFTLFKGDHPNPCLFIPIYDVGYRSLVHRIMDFLTIYIRNSSMSLPGWEHYLATSVLKMDTQVGIVLPFGPTSAGRLTFPKKYLWTILHPITICISSCLMEALKHWSKEEIQIDRLVVGGCLTDYSYYTHVVLQVLKPQEFYICEEHEPFSLFNEKLKETVVPSKKPTTISFQYQKFMKSVYEKPTRIRGEEDKIHKFIQEHGEGKWLSSKTLQQMQEMEKIPEPTKLPSNFFSRPKNKLSKKRKIEKESEGE